MPHLTEIGYWTCCHCDATNLVNPDQFYLSEDFQELCTWHHCNHIRCIACIDIDTDGNPTGYSGGRPLTPEALRVALGVNERPSRTEVPEEAEIDDDEDDDKGVEEEKEDGEAEAEIATETQNTSLIARAIASLNTQNATYPPLTNWATGGPSNGTSNANSNIDWERPLTRNPNRQGDLNQHYDAAYFNRERFERLYHLRTTATQNRISFGDNVINANEAIGNTPTSALAPVDPVSGLNFPAMSANGSARHTINGNVNQSINGTASSSINSSENVTTVGGAVNTTNGHTYGNGIRVTNANERPAREIWNAEYGVPEDASAFSSTAPVFESSESDDGEEEDQYPIRGRQ